jgi:hypothetical protein
LGSTPTDATFVTALVEDGRRQAQGSARDER